MCGGPKKTCNNVNGFCTLGCIDGYQGHRCQDRKLRESLSCPLRTVTRLLWVENCYFSSFFFPKCFYFFLHCFNYLLVRKYVNCANSQFSLLVCFALLACFFFLIIVNLVHYTYTFFCFNIPDNRVENKLKSITC